MGEKTGWTYFEISQKIASILNPGVKVSFRVKGKIDEVVLKQQAILPMGKGEFIMAVKSDLRKKLKKKNGDKISVSLSLDKTEVKVSENFSTCLQDEPEALKYFLSMPPSHQIYYSNWIESAKTENTKTKRIALAINTLAKKMNYGEMIRSQKKTN